MGPTNRGAQLLSGLMLDRGLTQSAVEQAIGCAAAMVTRWMSGARKPATQYRVQFWEVYGIPLVSWDEAPLAS